MTIFHEEVTGRGIVTKQINFSLRLRNNPHQCMMTTCTLQVRSQADEERAGREDATAAVMKMQSLITAVREDMVEAQLASDECTSVFLLLLNCLLDLWRALQLNHHARQREHHALQREPHLLLHS